MDLYLIIRAGDREPVWAGLTTAEEAEQKAVVTAVNVGACNLLSGAELATWLVERARESEPELILMYAVELDFGVASYWDRETGKLVPEVPATWSTAFEFNDPEAEWQIVTVCPHCGSITSDGNEAIYEVDKSVRWNRGCFEVDGRTRGDEDAGFSISQGDGDYHTDHFLCSACEKRITLPEFTDTSWS